MEQDADRPSLARIGQLLAGRYRVLSLVGEGRAGTVYLAEHEMMRKRVAVKLLHGEMAAESEAVGRLRREAEAAAHLDHPNIVAAKDFGRTDDGAFFLVMDHVEGTSLRDVLASGPLSSGRAMRIARQMALALGRAHRGGIIHRDIKPENVRLVQSDDEPELVKVLDFGIARIERPGDAGGGAAQPLTRLGTVLGTPEYMAPEQMVAQPATAASDLYALGVVFFELLAGRHPFGGDRALMMSMQVEDRIPTIEEVTPGLHVAPEVEAIVRRLLAKSPKDRPESAEAVVAAIDEAARPRGAGFTSPVTRGGEQKRSALALALVRRGLARANDVAWAALDAGTKRYGKGVVAGGAVVLAVLFLLGALGVRHLVRRPSESTGIVASAAIASVAPAEPTKAPPDRIRKGALLGPPALEELASEFPTDTAVLRELAFAYDGAGRTSDALRIVERTAASAKSAMPRDLVRIVLRAASKFDTADEAFRLLEGPLGADGVEGLLELSSDTGVPADARARAGKSLNKLEVRKNATDATAFMLDLRAATSCEAKRQVLARAKEHADARALGALRALRNTRGCGRHGNDDCHRCLRGDATLDRAIQAAEARAAP